MNETFDECVPGMVGPWCSTEIDADGFYIGGMGKWGYCGPGCPILFRGKLRRM